VDRLTHRSQILETGVESYRLRDSKLVRLLSELLEEEARRRKEFTKVVIIDVDYLYKSLREGYSQFRQDLKPGSKRAKRVARRAAEMYSQMVIERDRVAAL
jgi:hypothetical protein